MYKTTYLFAKILPWPKPPGEKDEISPHPDPIVPRDERDLGSWKLVGPPVILTIGTGEIVFIWTWETL